MNICHFAHHFVRVLFKHEQYIIYSQTISQTQLDDIAHEQTIIFRQLFAGHVLGSRPMKRTKNLHRMIKFLINRQQTHAKRGHPTTQCLQIRQKWLKWVFLYAFQAFLVHLELPSRLFIYSDVLRGLWSSPKFSVAFSSHSKPTENNQVPCRKCQLPR